MSLLKFSPAAKRSMPSADTVGLTGEEAFADTGWIRARFIMGPYGGSLALPLLAELAAGAQPFFLFVHYWDPHTPYLPPPPFDRIFYGGDERDPSNRSLEPVFAFEPFAEYFRSWMGEVTDIQFPIAQYDAEIAYLDATLGALFTRLDELGLTGETLLVINADHGECLDEHDCWFDHHGLYDQNLHVPLILRLPGVVPAGQRLDGFIRQYDLAPTILDLLGLGRLAAENQMDGVSFLPQLRSGSPAGTCDELFVTENSWMKKRGVRTHRWKLILAHEPDFHGKPPVELYDLAADPGELVNLAGDRPEVVAELRGRYDAWLARRTAASGKPDPQSYQGISLHRIGAMKMAVPADERLYAEGGKATEHGTAPPHGSRRWAVLRVPGSKGWLVRNIDECEAVELEADDLSDHSGHDHLAGEEVLLELGDDLRGSLIVGVALVDDGRTGHPI